MADAKQFTPVQATRKYFTKEERDAYPVDIRYETVFQGGPIAQTREANPEALEELRKDVYGWIKDVLPGPVLNRITVELTPYISRKGKNAKLSEEQWAEIYKQPGEIMGAATTNALHSFIELSYNFDNDTIQKSTYHEAFHVAARWLLPDADYKAVMDHFKGNEEAAANAFMDFAKKKKGKEAQPSFIKRIFRKLRLIFKRVRNGLQGKGFLAPEDVFKKLWGKEYEMLPESKRAERVAFGKNPRYNVVSDYKPKKTIIERGNKIRIKDTYEYKPRRGKIGVVTRKSDQFGWEVKLEDGNTVFVNESDMEIIEPTRLPPITPEENKKRIEAFIKANPYREITPLEEGDVFTRVVWGEIPDVIDPNSLDIVGMEQVGDDLRAIHVTDEPEFWSQKLQEDYGREGPGTVVEIEAMEGDILTDDPQYAIPEETGYMADSKVLITGRKIFRKGKDFIVKGETWPPLPEGGITRYSMAPKQTLEEWAKSYIQGYIDAQPKTKRAEVEKAAKKEEKVFDKEYPKDTVAIWDTVKNIPNISKVGWKEDKPDFKAWQRLLSVPSHFFHEVEAMGRVFNDGLENVDNRHIILDQITMAPDGHYYTVEIDTFAKQDKAGYKKLKEYLKHRDQNQIGYSIKKNEETKQWELFGVKDKKAPVAVFSDEQQAVDAMIQAEADDYRKDGASDQAVNALIAARKITTNGFEILFQAMRELMIHYQATGQELPTETVNIDGKAVTVDLKLALAKMGDMRGYYMPRIRKPGRYTVTAVKKGAHPLLKNFDSKKIAELWASNKKQQGYEVSLGKSKRMPEDVFEMAGQVIAQEAIINEALQRIRTKKYTLEDFGLEVVDRKQGPGKRDFMVKGPTTKQLNALFKRMGGRFFPSDPGGPRVWHFENPGAHFESRLAKAIAFERAAMEVDSSTQAVFAKALVEQVSNIIKGRGVRAHMIQRVDAKGLDVWEGYEEDPRIALAKYARGVSAGEAKKIMARNMLSHFTGTDISWQEFREMEGEDATYEDYLEFIENRRVDPVKQPNAFKEGKSYIQNMLRNEEAVDRLVGAVKGIAVLKYLGGRISAPLVNLTALVTSVPASMEGFGKIPIHKTFKYLAKASKLYGIYRFGNKNSLPDDIRMLFDEIHNKGWHNAQYNREALAVLRGKVGRGWDKLIDWSMIGFGATEQLNRVSTIAGAYLGLKAQGQKDHDAMMALAKKISDQAHGTYGKANYPLIARGSHPAAQVMKAFYVFKTFSHNYMLTMKDLWGDGWRPENGKAFVYMAVSPAILAGAGGIVGWELIMKAIASAFDLDDPEEDMYNWLEANINEYVVDFARFGGFGLIGMNLKGSLEIGVTDLPTTWKDVLGAPGSVISDFYEGGVNIAKGNISKGLEKISPLAIAGPIKAYREATEGLTTRTNAPIFYGRERVKADTTDAILRALSFNPAGIAKIREQKWAERQQELKYAELRTEIYSKIKKFMLQPVGDRNKVDWLNILEDVREYNERIKRRGLRGIVPFITKRSIRTNLRRSFRPRKSELRRRAKMAIGE